MTTARLLIGLTLLGLTLPIAARAEDQPIEVQIVDALNKAFGVHPGFRANHAKGIVVEGSFKASPAGGEAEPRRAVRRQHDPGDGALLRFRPAYRTCRTAPTSPIRTAWRSSTICRTAATPTW